MDTVTDEVKLRNAGRIPYSTLQVSRIKGPSGVMLIFPPVRVLLELSLASLF